MGAARHVMIAAVLATLAGAGAGCSAGQGTPPGVLSVVTSTNVYADIAATLAGSLNGGPIRVTALIADPSIDPHSYEASARNGLAVHRADLIIENGGGYDDFVDRLRSASNDDVPIVDAVALSGHAGDADLNEHVWYDLPTVKKVAKRISAFFKSHVRGHAAELAANERNFLAGAARLAAVEKQIKAAHGGDSVAITEPVPLYMLTACGLKNRTPPEFSEAVEEGGGVALRTLRATLALFADRQVALLVYNAQTGGREIDQLREAAERNGIPQVAVRESLPTGIHYLDWIGAMLDAIRAAPA